MLKVFDLSFICIAKLEEMMGDVLLHKFCPPPKSYFSIKINNELEKPILLLKPNFVAPSVLKKF